MITHEIIVIDTNVLISYFDGVFNVGQQISKHALRLFEQALKPYDSNIKISIPSLVFVEIFEKWLGNQEFSRRFYYEVFTLIKDSPNIEIMPLDKYVLQELIMIGGKMDHHDLHDKIILASAISLGCKLITSDAKIIQYVNDTHVIPGIIS